MKTYRFLSGVVVNLNHLTAPELRNLTYLVEVAGGLELLRPFVDLKNNWRLPGAIEAEEIDLLTEAGNQISGRFMDSDLFLDFCMGLGQLQQAQAKTQPIKPDGPMALAIHNDVAVRIACIHNRWDYEVILANEVKITTRVTRGPRRSSIACEIHRERTAKGWSVEKLATAAGVSKGTVSKIENGSNFSVEVLHRILDALGTEPILIGKL